MLAGAGLMQDQLLAIDPAVWLANTVAFLKVLIGFSIIIFVHELGHFIFAKWCGVRIDRFAIGFGPRLFGWRPGEGFTWGATPNLKAEELTQRGWGETDYCFRALPIGGYVKMLGQDDIIIDEDTGDISMTDDPRAFTNRPVGHRMLIVSAGVIFNVLFAALLFMCVFLLGMEMPAPVIGRVEPGTPADLAGIQAGDRVLTINRWRADSFMDIRRAEILSDQLTMTIERDGEVLDQEFVLDPDWEEARNLHFVGIDPTLTPRIIADNEPLPGEEAPRKGDLIVEINGIPIRDFPDVMITTMNSDGRPVEMVFERVDPNRPDAPPERVRMTQNLVLGVHPASKDSMGEDEKSSDYARRHVLGFLSRWGVSFVQEGSPAEEAGFQRGDIVVAWGSIADPVYEEITKVITANANQPIRVLVDRPGRDDLVEIEVTPKRRFRLFGQAPPQVGISFMRESRQPVVADVVPGTPAAALDMPRGATIMSVDGNPVGDWLELARLLKEAAGRTIEVEYIAGGQVASGEMHLPSSIVNEAGLPADADVVSIDGEKTVKNEDGDTLRLPALSALRELLKQNIGETVTVAYRRKSEPSQVVEVPFTVREDNIDPWQARLVFGYVGGMGEVLMERVDANGNPLRATWMGIKLTYSYVITTYQTIRQMLRANVSVEHVSGPVGIIGHAVEQAKVGMADLLWFLAFLSINLAVLNFLPIPLVDGGVMVFLIIEKVRGTPLSIKTQMIATLAGLSLIVVTFVVVTYQDLMRLFFG